MKFNTRVKYKGVYYPTGAEVPVGISDVTETEEQVVEETEEKKYTNKQIRTMRVEDLRQVINELGYKVEGKTRTEMVDIAIKHLKL